MQKNMDKVTVLSVLLALHPELAEILWPHVPKVIIEKQRENVTAILKNAEAVAKKMCYVLKYFFIYFYIVIDP